MLIVNDDIRISDEELQYDFARSGGPGGQNVNKVASKVLLRWNPARSAGLPETVRARLLRRLAGRLTTEGDLLLTSQRTRDQGRNIADCLEKLRLIVLAAATPPRPRIPTRPTAASRRRRLDQKVRRSTRKRNREVPGAE